MDASATNSAPIEFMPHGHCYFWQPELLYVHVISDALIALSYASIPAALIYFVIRRKDLKFSSIFVLFGIFILACGATHLMNIYTVWVPAYYLSGALKVITAAASVGTALVLWKLIPVLLRLPSPAQLEEANAQLAHEIEGHKLAREELSAQAQELENQTRLLQGSNRKLADSNQLLEEFTSMVAHDLKEPLRKICSFGSMLQREVAEQLEGRPKDRLERMISAAQRMQRLIDDLLNYAIVSQREPKMAEIDLNKVLHEVQENLLDRVNRTQGRIDIETPLPTLEGDVSHLTQLFQNIIGNGLKFHRPETPPLVTVHAEAVEQLPHTPVPGWKLTITDNGIGIAQENLDKIFGAFERLHTRTEYEGTGIGLSVCARAVERHTGQIQVSSEEGVGSTFTIWLPEKQPDDQLFA